MAQTESQLPQKEKEYLGILKRANWILFQTERTMKEKEFGV